MLSLRGLTKVLEETLPAATSCWTRNFARFSRAGAKTVQPAEIKSRERPVDSLDLEDGPVDVRELQKEFRKDVLKEFQVRGDVSELDVDPLQSSNWNDYQREREELKSNVRKTKMFKKHFRESMEEKEVSLLTYAEKEKIRYLHSTDPAQWTPEALSESFPISPEGAIKVIKSSFRCKSFAKIQAHDKAVAEKIEQIKEGLVPMTPDLEEKMKMREKIPLTVGAIDLYDKNMLLKLEAPKIVGEFESLVLFPNPQVKESSGPTTLLALPDNTEYEDEPDIHRQPDLGDSRVLPPTLKSIKALNKAKLPLDRRMTFSQFKTFMELEEKSRDKEVRYIAKLKHVAEPKPTALSDFENEEAIESKVFKKKIIQKFKMEEVAAEDQPNISSARASKSSHSNFSLKEMEKAMDRLNANQDQEQPVKQGSMYRKGNSYYDENGEFIYRVV